MCKETRNPCELEWVSFDLETETGPPKTNRVSGVLIDSANTRRTLVPSDWYFEHVHLTLCFDFDLSGEQDSAHKQQGCVSNPGGGGYSYILALRVRAAGKGVVLKPFALEYRLVIIDNWSRIGSRLTG